MGDRALRILIVEDQLLIAKQLELIAEAAGHIVVGTASTGAEATALAESLGPDIAFVDVNLDERASGLHVAAFITGAFKALVVFTTANAKMIPQDCCGAVGFVEKPFTEIGLFLVLTYLAGKVKCGQSSNFRPETLRLSPTYSMLWT